jgi:DNA-directed RNA polymerase subunit M/transcription elongation factor TFIIS
MSLRAVFDKKKTQSIKEVMLDELLVFKVVTIHHTQDSKSAKCPNCRSENILWYQYQSQYSLESGVAIYSMPTMWS